ncbi:hypothetical protein LEP1GSC050_1091 [Leptospira broomii serovar Hurstbridge str. 5399]|uniref:GDSL-like lipase/acylhydrolase family protein n=1 Tax=Leptospira broomii serovar Hurstbridge str. 5399 TaxID=1049789 RepID=T0FH47_9LEPT|nr:SGNH/GDSL hydrolase family protein [Leptospira broomii]EQA47286.1 hypothetical protein LEP1GSC050_1091 [Leptospira broomii serovar Hurstbridge str. 5399]
MSFAKKAGWILFLVGIAFLGTEVGLRFLKSPSLQYYRDLKVLHQYHPDYYVGLEPNQSLFVRHFAGKWEGQISTNSLGLRGTKDPISNKPKLLCLGDSLVMGFGVGDPDTFCSLLDGLELKGGARQSLNLGVDAYGSSGSYLRLKDISARLDHVSEVLFFISPNDFDMPEALAAKGILPDDQTDAARESDPNYRRNFRIQFELTKWSYALQAMKLAWEQLSVTASVTKMNIANEIKSAGMSENSQPGENLGSYIKNSFYHPPKRPNCSPVAPVMKEAALGPICPEPVPADVRCSDTIPKLTELEPLPELTQRSYDGMIALAKEKGFRLIPVIVPIQVEEIYCYNNGKYHKLENYAIRSASYFEKKGIPVMRLKKDTVTMCKIGTDGRRIGILDHFIPEDGHFTKIGNQWLAEAIAKHLKESPFAL